MAEILAGEITSERVMVPRKDITVLPKKVIRAVLEPVETSYPDYIYPPEIPYASYKEYAPQDKTLILDIETTGADPTKSRLICIGCLDASNLQDPTQVFIGATEIEMIEPFMAYFLEKGFTKIVGYNLSFDLRFLFALYCRYRVVFPELFAAEVEDLMQRMEQIHYSFVYGRNKAGSLEDWAYYFFGMRKTMGIEEMWKAWEAGDAKTVAEYNTNDLVMTTSLYFLTRYTLAEIPELPEPLKGEAQAFNPGTMISAECPKCHQVQQVAADAGNYTCSGCGTEQKL